MTKNNKTVAFCTLGCRVNQYETRAVEEAFINKGFSVGKFTDKCDVYVINTCTVTGESDRKSRQMIRRAVKNGKGKAVVAVMGCMSQVDADAVRKIDGVSVVLGNGDKMSAVDLVIAQMGIISDDSIPVYSVPDIYSYKEIENMSVTGSDNTRAFLKVVDGCENHCSYCIIPSARGKVRSKKPEDVVEECKAICKVGGCREIVLTGIETAAYGKDIGCDLATLVEKVSENPDVKRIRLGSLEPTVLKEDFVKRLSAVPNFMPHFHLSLQSGSDSVLARMKRKYNTKMFYEKLELLRKYFPDCEITTDIIVGFPGETNEEFKQTLVFIEKCRFLYIHIFPYSDRKDTVASKMDGKLSLEEKTKRCAILNKRMLEIRREILDGYIGRKMPVLCEQAKNGLVHGYTPNFIETRFENNAAKPNDIIEVTLSQIEENAEFVFGL
ncbi:MAG: tRNA (N(6)-L-threonylcarbamoyladenosine(37)-C(2))-methylthiotransferase MtaB [Ruminococcaceae bacterium]|nr:tRNA (N(6)-L-threonylcarbamoyladenosine(37)-C(2))-methylthiotransferase MtaB [Oscillospiraceae bacterium]